MHEIFVVVTGVVQGVSYRAYVQDSAMGLEINGYVRNMEDGTVEVVGQGTQDILKEFIEYLHEGSLQAKVASVAVDWKTANKVYDEFSILYERN